MSERVIKCSLCERDLIGERKKLECNHYCHERCIGNIIQCKKCVTILPRLVRTINLNNSDIYIDIDLLRRIEDQ